MVLVTTREFSQVIEVGEPVSQAKIYEAQFADELIFLNIDSSPIEPRAPLLDVLRRAASETFMPIAVGGGVRTTDDFELLLANGADKVCINSAAVADPSLIERAAAIFGAQCVVVSIDYRHDAQGARVFIDGGRTATSLDPVEWSIRAAALGAGEILLTDIGRDGSGQGLDIATIRRVADGVSVPVIASGGCGLAQHFVEGFVEGHAEAVAAGTFFCFRDQNPMQTRAHVRNAGVPIRIKT
ncbi:MAG: imidazole glycerol phosphate synthase cyclase subunit [Burkholderiaceae bacterium]|nr:imidazole glycerol phosphate synthase cyclase subunit [Burkholderiaceae bacterium]